MKSAVLSVKCINPDNDDIPQSFKIEFTDVLKARIVSLSHVLKAMKGASISVDLDSENANFVLTDEDLNLLDGLGGSPDTISCAKSMVVDCILMEVTPLTVSFIALPKYSSDDWQLRTTPFPVSALHEDIGCYIQ
ncbi:MAG: hypothetical protein ACJAS1_000560 [Oleiphilaceae bacterium]|jgi:hypothetical protein